MGAVQDLDAIRRGPTLIVRDDDDAAARLRDGRRRTGHRGSRLAGADQDHRSAMYDARAPDTQMESVALAAERGGHQTTGLNCRQSGLEAGPRCGTQRARARGRAQPPPLYHRTMSTPSFEIPPPPPAAPAMGFVDTWRRVMSDPRSFFADMPQAGGLPEPLASLSVCAAVDAIGPLLMGWGIRGMVGTFVTLLAGGFVSA